MPTGVTEIFEAVLNRGAELRVKVTGRSMTPFLNDGEIVTITPAPPHSLKTGDVIFFKGNAGKLLMHRVIRKTFRNGKIFLRTKGDAWNVLDAPIAADNVLGKVSAIEAAPSQITAGRRINLDAFGQRLRNYLLARGHLVKASIYRLFWG